MTFEEWTIFAKLTPGSNRYLLASYAWIAAANSEREACAEICDKIANNTEPDDFALDAVNEAADAIRMRHAAQTPQP